MKKVIILEDMRSFSTMLATLIKDRFAFEADIAKTFQEAKALLEKNSQDYFVAISDLNLPDAEIGEGVDLFNQYEIPVLVFTSKLDGGIQEDIVSKGVADYTIKRGDHNIEYVVNMVDRIYRNYSTKVLIVDDSESASLVAAKLLNLQRYQTQRAKSAEEALKVLDENHDFKLVLIDCNLGGMDGITLTTEIRRQYSSSELAIVGVSGTVGKTKLILFLKQGADDFILKPLVQEEFLCRISQVVTRLEMTQNLEKLNQRKNAMIGMAAHDIRGPLGAIIGYGKRAEKANDENRIMDCVKTMTRCASETLELVDEILCIAEIEDHQLKIKPEGANLGDVCKDTIENYKVLSDKKGQQIISEISDIEDNIFDVSMIKQVIGNLVTNAIKYSPKEGVIKIEVYSDAGKQYCAVVDSGPGIKKELLNKLFVPYETLGTHCTGGEKSTGLGLSICQGLLRSHSGDIEYFPGEAGGSVFQFSLPLLRNDG